MNHLLLRYGLAALAGAGTTCLALTALVVGEIYYEDLLNEDPTPAQLLRDGAILGGTFVGASMVAARQLRKVMP